MTTPVRSWKRDEKTNSTRRPEEIGNDPGEFFNEQRAVSYATSDKVLAIQHELTDKTLQLLELLHASCSPSTKWEFPRLVLDCGCGTAFSCRRLVHLASAHGTPVHVIGYDVSQAMVEQASAPRTDFVQADMKAMPFGTGPGCFDAAISISAMQWLCEVEQENLYGEGSPLHRFLSDLHRCLAPDGKAAIQYYPKTAQQCSGVEACAKLAGFESLLVIDFPHGHRNGKFFLLLSKQRKIVEQKVQCPLSRTFPCACGLALNQDAESLTRLRNEHLRYAYKVLRLHRRIQSGFQLPKKQQPTAKTQRIMNRLARVFVGGPKNRDARGEEPELSLDMLTERWDEVYQAMHIRAPATDCP